jgi:hypothetical protein
MDMPPAERFNPFSSNEAFVVLERILAMNSSNARLCHVLYCFVDFAGKGHGRERDADKDAQDDSNKHEINPTKRSRFMSKRGAFQQSESVERRGNMKLR